MAKLPTARVYRFGPYEVDLTAGELRKHGVKIRLQDQPFRVLAALARRPGTLLTREELCRELWGGDTFVDFEHGLNAAVRRLREALSDSARQPRYIETLPRRGYRFLAPVEVVGAEASVGRVMLAVLPFRSPGSDPGEEYFAEGMSEEMIGQLGRLDPAGLGVIARASTFRYKDSTKTAEEIGRELGVDFLLEGSVRRSGGRVRIHARLIRVSDQSQLWAESFDETVEDVLAIQIECAGSIASSLAVELVAGQREAMGRAITQNPLAYEAYLRGRYYWNRRTREGFARAVESFEVAIAADPGFALARVGLADVYNLLGLYGLVPAPEAAERGKRAAGEALAIDPGLAEAHISLAHNRFLYEWNWPGAEEAFRRGLKLNANLAHGHYLYAFFLASRGRFNQAFTHIEKAMKLDPVSPVVHTYFAWVCYFSRDYDRARAGFEAAIELDPAFSLAWIFLGLTLLQKGEWASAVEAFRHATEGAGGPPGATSALAVALRLDGRKQEAERAIDGGADSKEYVSPYYRALAALGAGQPERALDALEAACEERSPWLVCLEVEPAMDSLRSRSRFRKLVGRVGSSDSG